MSFQTSRNYQESAVYELIGEIAPRYPSLSSSQELLADVACLALNSLSPRYIRHEVDLHFFMTNSERALNRLTVCRAIEAAFEHVERTERAGTGRRGSR
jgi:hypothetical protein